MQRNKLAWRLYLVLMTIMLVPLIGLTWYAVRTFDRMNMARTVADVKVQTRMVSTEFQHRLVPTLPPHSVDSTCKTIGKSIGSRITVVLPNGKVIGKSIGSRITVVLPNGKVIGDSEKDPDSMENHAYRPEIIEAFAGRQSVETRLSATMQRNMVYIASPLAYQGAIIAALRLAVPVESIKKVERGFYLSIFAAGLCMLVLLAIVIYYLTQRISAPIQAMKKGAERFAAGDLDFKVGVPQGEEMAKLALALNTMASQLDDRIKTITRQHNQLEAILCSMSEGVVAVDKEERIISLNPAAAGMLETDRVSARGKWLHEVVRNSSLQRFLTQTIKGLIQVDTSFSLSSAGGERHIQAHGSILTDDLGQVIGALIVLADVTALRRLENIRKAFVANVSHELRTPLTSIKGFVETIQQGEYVLPAEVERFLAIISARTDRLCSIVDDLLSLSSIERDHERKEVTFTIDGLLNVISEAIASCQARADAKLIKLATECPADLMIRMNALLLEQAVVNLVENAIKYSDEGKTVSIRAVMTERELVIEVIDQGIGIGAEHLDRLFERFYRVDKARSRKLGGTGLGLSIVKNIVAAHEGRVSVESKLGAGSTFRIHLPIDLKNT